MHYFVRAVAVAGFVLAGGFATASLAEDAMTATPMASDAMTAAPMAGDAMTAAPMASDDAMADCHAKAKTETEAAKQAELLTACDGMAQSPMAGDAMASDAMAPATK